MLELHLTNQGWTPVHVPVAAVCQDGSTSATPAARLAPVYVRATGPAPVHEQAQEQGKGQARVIHNQEQGRGGLKKASPPIAGRTV